MRGREKWSERTFGKGETERMLTTEIEIEIDRERERGREGGWERG